LAVTNPDLMDVELPGLLVNLENDEAFVTAVRAPDSRPKRQPPSPWRRAGGRLRGSGREPGCRPGWCSRGFDSLRAHPGQSGGHGVLGHHRLARPGGRDRWGRTDADPSGPRPETSRPRLPGRRGARFRGGWRSPGTAGACRPMSSRGSARALGSEPWAAQRDRRPPGLGHGAAGRPGAGALGRLAAGGVLRHRRRRLRAPVGRRPGDRRAVPAGELGASAAEPESTPVRDRCRSETSRRSSPTPRRAKCSRR
jgi:hypothetical protein